MSLSLVVSLSICPSVSRALVFSFFLSCSLLLSFALIPSHSLSFSNTHTHTQSHTHIHIHSCTHRSTTQTRTQTYTCARAHAHTHMLLRSSLCYGDRFVSKRAVDNHLSPALFHTLSFWLSLRLSHPPLLSLSLCSLSRLFSLSGSCSVFL